MISTKAKSELRDSLIAVWRKKNNERHRLVGLLNTKINTLKQTKTDLTISYATASPTMKVDIEAEIDRVRAEINDHEQRKQLLLQDDKEIEKFVRFAFNYLNDLPLEWWSLEPEQRDWCQKIIFPGEIIVHPDYEIGTNKLSPIFTLGNIKSSPKTANNVLLVEMPGTAPGSEK